MKGKEKLSLDVEKIKAVTELKAGAKYIICCKDIDEESAKEFMHALKYKFGIEAIVTGYDIEVFEVKE